MTEKERLQEEQIRIMEGVIETQKQLIHGLEEQVSHLKEINRLHEAVAKLAEDRIESLLFMMNQQEEYSGLTVELTDEEMSGLSDSEEIGQ